MAAAVPLQIQVDIRPKELDRMASVSVYDAAVDPRVQNLLQAMQTIRDLFSDFDQDEFAYRFSVRSEVDNVTMLKEVLTLFAEYGFYYNNQTFSGRSIFVFYDEADTTKPASQYIAFNEFLNIENSNEAVVLLIVQVVPFPGGTLTQEDMDRLDQLTNVFTEYDASYVLQPVEDDDTRVFTRKDRIFRDPEGNFYLSASQESKMIRYIQTTGLAFRGKLFMSSQFLTSRFIFRE